jgi:nucleotide-binding universal stress UspA family protein
MLCTEMTRAFSVINAARMISFPAALETGCLIQSFIETEVRMANLKILVPYNFTSSDEKTLDFVIQQFDQQRDAAVTLFHAYVPVPDIEISDKTVMSRIAGNITYLRQKIYDLEEALQQARQRLISAGFAEDKVDYVFKPLEKEAALDIIQHAGRGVYTTIVLNRNPSKIRKFFMPSVSKKVTKALKNIDLYMVQ